MRMPQANKPSTTPSLPGKLATRTDGGVASKQAQRYVSGMPSYGDGQDLMNLQAQAPMGATPDLSKPTPAAAMQPQGQAQQGQPGQQLTPLTAPTQRPNEPVTAGAPAGAGPGPEALNLPAPDVSQYQTAKEQIQAMAASATASPALKQLASRFNQVY